MVTKGDELSLFLELRRREKEMEKSNLLVDDQETKGGFAPVIQAVPQQMAPFHRNAAEKFLDSENEKSDYDWLITPPGTPLLPSKEMEAQSATRNQLGTNARPTILKSRLTNIQQEAPSTNGASKPKIMPLPSVLNSSSAGNRRSSFSGEPKPASRPSTPTSRPTLPSAKPTRSSTPTGRPTLSSSKPSAALARSSTPTRTTPRSSTPTSRHSFPSSKSASRSSTPTPSGSAPVSRSSSVTRSASIASKKPAPSRGISPTVKSRPLKPDAMPESVPKRPASATKARPGTRSSSNAAASIQRPRQQSCSPAKSRSSNGIGSGGKLPISIKSRIQTTTDCDDVNPVLMGTQSVERVVNMRKLAPPKQDNHSSSYQSHSTSKPSSHDSSGFGRSLSKKSLDMAMRHMDIGRSITGNLRPVTTSTRASSTYSTRSDGSTKGRAISASESPHATSSNASSEPSVNNIAFFVEAEENDTTS
ncbi:hypothetical protein LINPERHAP2_LOCUS8229 [Linum perenne]